MHITLTGNLGSGKSTICKILRDKYGFEIYSTGTVQRKIAEDMGISVLEMNELMCKDHSYDHLIDDTTAKLSKENQDKDIVFDSRLAWHFVEKSYKVFLSVSIDEASRRVFADTTRGNVESYKSLEECKSQLRARAANENMRYDEIYGIHYMEFENYDLVLDSSYASPEVLAEMIVKLAKAHEEEQVGKLILFCPERLGYVTDKTVGKLPCYYEEPVSIEKTEDDYKVISESDAVKNAAESGRFVWCITE